MKYAKIALALAAPASFLLASPALAAGPVDPLTALASQGNVTMYASIVHDVTPDDINMYISCDVQKPGTRREVRASFQELFENIESATQNNLESEGTVRRNGPLSVYPNYGPDPTSSQQFTGNMSVAVKYVKSASALKLSEAIEDMGCAVSWDAHLDHTAKYARELKTELMSQISEKREVYEDFLGQKLTRITGMSLDTSTDPYAAGYTGGYTPTNGTYDPRSNKVTVTTTANITYALDNK